MQKVKLHHFHSDMGTNSNIHNSEPYHQTPSDQTVQQAKTLGRVVVGNADIIYQNSDGKEYITVIVGLDNGMGRNIYRDMYRVINN